MERTTYIPDEQKLRVCIITDINKASKLLKKRQIDPDEFDYLYDLDIMELNNVLKMLVMDLRLMASIKRAKEAWGL